MPPSPPPSAPQRETIDFTMHPHLLADVIRRQAGTLEKAITEAVMNSVDAGATQLTIDLTFTTVHVHDNGRGFDSEATIRECFGQFGTPHTQEEQHRQTFAQFRQGRGQLLALGRTVWRSGTWRMSTDIERNGLHYVLDRNQTSTEGCIIDIELYRRLDTQDLMEVKRQLTRYVKYVRGTVMVNGAPVSTDPDTLHWTATREEAYYQLRAAGEQGYGGLDLYNLGVLVTTIPAHRWGLSGTVVSRQPLLVNFARNEVLGSCPVLQRIHRYLNDASSESLGRKKHLSPEERLSLIRQILTGKTALTNHSTSPLFLDASGHGWSADAIKRLLHNSTWTKTPAHKIAFSFAEPGRAADRVLQDRTCLVLDPIVREWFEHTGTPERFFEDIGCWSVLRIMEYIPFAQVRSLMAPETWHLLPPEVATAREKRLLAALSTSLWRLTAGLNALGRCVEPRTLRLGEGEGAASWTDGRSYIALHRHTLRRTPTSPHGFMTLSGILLHELCHLENDIGDHGHEPAFYRLFHDAHDSAVLAAYTSYNTYLSRLRQAGRKLLTSQESQALREQERQDLEQQLHPDEAPPPPAPDEPPDPHEPVTTRVDPERSPAS